VSARVGQELRDLGPTLGNQIRSDLVTINAIKGSA